MQALLSGSDYQKNLHQCLKDITNSCRFLESQANMSLAYRLDKDNIQLMQQGTSILKDNLFIKNFLSSIDAGVQMNNMGMLFFANLFNQFLPILSDLERERQSRSPLIRTPSPLPQFIEEQPFWSAQDIGTRVLIPSLDEEDLRNVAHKTSSIVNEDKGRAQQVLGNRMFRNWMRSRGSAKLLVHGNFQPPFLITPLSVVCTLLTHTFRNYSESFIGLVFFCGQHLICDQYHGGTVMIQSLIAQLLRQHDFGMIKPDLSISLEDIEKCDITALCRVFSLLIQQLPSSMIIFCLVDGISLYETEEYLDGMDLALLTLIDLVDEGKYEGRSSFKLLITSPRPTSEVRRIFAMESDTLLHMDSLPLLGGSIGVAGLQERLASDIFG